MELRQLKYFVHAAELQNFTNAANQLYITQSTLSQQIKQLEDTVGVPLFDRIGKRVRLTEGGRMFLDHARKTLRHAAEGQQVLHDLVNLQTGNLIIGATYGLSSLLVSTLAVFSRQHPRIHVDIVFGSTAQLIERLHTSSIDCMLSFMDAGAAPSLATQSLFPAHLSLVVHKTHPYARRKKMALKDLPDLSLALPAKSYSVRGLLDHAMEMAAVPMTCQLELNDINMLLQLAETGNWGTVLMNSSLFGFPSLKAIPIDAPDMRRQASMASLPDIYQKKSLLAFQKMLIKESAARSF